MGETTDFSGQITSIIFFSNLQIEVRNKYLQLALSPMVSPRRYTKQCRAMLALVLQLFIGHCVIKSHMTAQPCVYALTNVLYR